jgi:hypothetical protein
MCSNIREEPSDSRMIYSKSGNFVFIHIYKNAGTSIRDALKSYDDTFHKRRLLENLMSKYTPFSATLAPQGHIRARDAKNWIGEQKWSELYSFAVVRNPWDWQVSLYSYMMKLKSHHQHDLVSSFKSFDDYISWRCSEDAHLQLDFVTDESSDTIVVKDIYRFETINEDIKKLESRIGAKVMLKVLNQSNRGNYREFYTGRSKDMVAEYFSKDIDRFGYEY